MEASGKIIKGKFEAVQKILKACAALPCVGGQSLTGPFPHTANLKGAPATCKCSFHTKMGALLKERETTWMGYLMATGSLFLRCADGGAGKTQAGEEFARLCACKDFTGSADRLVAGAEALLGSHGVKLRTAQGKKATKAALPKAIPEGKTKSAADSKGAPAPTIPKPPAAAVLVLQRMFDAYPSGAASAEAKTGAQNYEHCADCGEEMEAEAEFSELVCHSCGLVRNLPGCAFDDAQYYSQEGQKSRSGAFNPNRHFHFWWQHIYAREPISEIGDSDKGNEHGEKLIEKMRHLIKRDNILLQLLTVDNARAMLRELNKTSLNKNVALLIRVLTGRGPPTPSDTLAAKVEKYFSLAIEVAEGLPNNGRTNRHYYPYYQMKLLDALLPEKDYEQRRVFLYIYYQSGDTIANDDSNWELICKDPRMKGITYRPTNRQAIEKYRFM